MSHLARLLVLLSALGCTRALAQDASRTGKQVAERYQQSLQLSGGKPLPRSSDARLHAAFLEKVAACYTHETNAPLPEKSRSLLNEYAPELV
jgi:hypothetical protein